MIVKSMSRKTKSFSQLYDYLTRDKSNFSFSKNTYSNAKDKKNLIKEFMKNSEYLDDSRGKVFLYHELISLNPNTLSLQQQKEILLDLANKYLDIRAQNNLSFGVIHEDKNHIHLHLMISSNEIESDKRVRLSKKEFALIQKHLENYKNDRYSELEKSSFYQNEKDLSKTFKMATSKTYFDNYLKSLNYEIYQRGQTIGIIYENKNYRLKTLGLETEYLNMLKEFENIKQREAKRQKAKDEKINERFR